MIKPEQRPPARLGDRSARSRSDSGVARGADAWGSILYSVAWTEHAGERAAFWCSQEALAGMLAEALMIADIFGDHIDRGVATMLAHLEQIGVLSSRLGEKARA